MSKLFHLDQFSLKTFAIKLNNWIIIIINMIHNCRIVWLCRTCKHADYSLLTHCYCLFNDENCGEPSRIDKIESIFEGDKNHSANYSTSFFMESTSIISPNFSCLLQREWEILFYFIFYFIFIFFVC